MNKKRTRLRRITALLLMICMVWTQAIPVYADETTASSMRLTKAQGTVSVTNKNGRDMGCMADMKLFHGYNISTADVSYAWINLDDSKLIKLDAVSEMEIQKRGKKLEILLNSGNLFFNVSEPLKTEESLNIRTSTTITGIRGTSGGVKVMSSTKSMVYALSGHLECYVMDQVSGEVKQASLEPGEVAEFVVHDQDYVGDKCEVIVHEVTEDNIDGFVAVELINDPEFYQTVRETLPALNLDQVTRTAEQKLRQAEHVAETTIEVVAEQMKQQEQEMRQEEQQAAQQTGQGGKQPDKVIELFEDTSSKTQIPDEPTWDEPAQDEPAPQPPVSEQPAPVDPDAVLLSVTEAEQTLDTRLAMEEVTNIVIRKSATETDDTLNLAVNTTLPSGKTLTLEDVDLVVEEGVMLRVYDTLTVDGDVINQGTIMNSSMESLVISGTLENEGLIENIGRINANAIDNRGSFKSGGNINVVSTINNAKSFENTGTINAKTIDNREKEALFANRAELYASVKVSSGKFTMDNGLVTEGLIVAGSDAVVSFTGGTINGGEKADAAILVEQGSVEIDMTGADSSGRIPTITGDDPTKLISVNGGSVIFKESEEIKVFSANGFVVATVYENTYILKEVHSELEAALQIMEGGDYLKLDPKKHKNLQVTTVELGPITKSAYGNTAILDINGCSLKITSIFRYGSSEVTEIDPQEQGVFKICDTGRSAESRVESLVLYNYAELELENLTLYTGGIYNHDRASMDVAKCDMFATDLQMEMDMAGVFIINEGKLYIAKSTIECESYVAFRNDGDGEVEVDSETVIHSKEPDSAEEGNVEAMDSNTEIMEASMVPLAAMPTIGVGIDGEAGQTVPVETWNPAASAMDVICAPAGIMMLDDGSIIVTDTYNKVVWKTKDRDSAVIAGKLSVADAYGEPVGGYVDGMALNSYFKKPWAAAKFLNGIAVTDSVNNVVRFIGADGIGTAVGSGSAGFANGTGVKASFHNPTGLASDPQGNLYVADTNNNVIRKVTSKGVVTTYLTDVNEPTGLFWSGDCLYVAESGAHRILKVKKGTIVERYGTGEDGDVTGAVDQAQFSFPQGVAVSSDGCIYISDTGNSAIKKLQNGVVTTLLMRDTANMDLYPVSPMGIAIKDDQLYVCDNFAKKVIILKR